MDRVRLGSTGLTAIGAAAQPPGVCGDNRHLLRRQAGERHHFHRVRRDPHRRGQGLLCPDRALVTGDPSYSSPNGTAQSIKAPVKLTPVDARLRLDLEGLIRGAIGAGLVFLCNPNNPTSSVHTMSDIEQAVRTIKTRSPGTGILIDEAYLEYATLPGSGSMVKLALELPGVFITRTFSKAYGLRVRNAQHE